MSCLSGKEWREQKEEEEEVWLEQLSELKQNSLRKSRLEVSS
jgi:hypothetical protein